MLLSPCQIKYYGWKFRVEAHFGEKRNQIVLRVCFCHQRTFKPLDGSAIPDLVVESTHIYLAQLPQNSNAAWLKLFP